MKDSRAAAALQVLVGLCAMLMAMSIASCGDDQKGGDDVRSDIAETVDPGDAGDVRDTSSDGRVDATDVVDDVDLDAANDDADADAVIPIEWDVVERTVAAEASTLALDLGTAAEVVDLAVGDLDGDGYDDIVALAGAELLLVRRDPHAGARPPLALESPHRIELPFAPQLAACVHIDDNARLDIALLDVVGGRLAVILNAGGPVTSAFDGAPLVFEHTDMALGDPALARRTIWTVDDFDGDGFGDIAIAAGGKGVLLGHVEAADTNNTMPLAVVWTASAEDGTAPSHVLAVDVAGTPKLAVAWWDEAGQQGTLAAFDVLPDHTLAALDGARVSTSSPIHELATGDLDEDGGDDLVWTAADTEMTHVGVWRSGAGAAPLTTPASTWNVQMEFSGLSLGRLLLDADTGSGGGGPDGLAELDYRSHVVLHETGKNSCVAIPLTDAGFGPLTEVDAQRPFRGEGYDLDGDGFLEFVALAGFDLELIYQQRILYANYSADVYLLADGSSTPMCEIVAPECAMGSQGVCQATRESCSGCTPSQVFSAEYGAEFSALFEVSEQTCDGWDNDCDGLVDVLGSTPLDPSVLGVIDGARHLVATARGWVLVVEPTVTGDSVAHYLIDAPVSPTMPSPTTTTVTRDASFDAVVRASSESVAVLGRAGVDTYRLSVIDANDGETTATFNLPDAEAGVAAPLFVFGAWWVVWERPGAAAGETVVVATAPLSAGGFTNTAAQVQTTLALAGTSDRLYSLVASGDKVWGASLDATGAEARGAVTVLQGRGVVDSGALDMEGNLQCIAAVDTVSGRTRLALTSATATLDSLTPAPAPVELTTDDVVPGSLRTVAEAGACRFVWAARLPGASGLAVVREAELAPAGELLAVRDLVTVPLGAGAPDLWLTEVFGRTNATVVTEGAPGTLLNRPICPRP